MEQLFEEERKARVEGDLERLREVQHGIVAACATDSEVISALKMLTHKRKQDPHCIKDLIMSLHREGRSIDFYRMLLGEVIESRIYLEEERMYVAEHITNLLGNDIEQAYAAIKDVPVETFTSINEKRRNAFLFEQFRIALLLHLYSDASLIAKRVRKSYLSNEEKVFFYNYSILLKIGQREYLETAMLFLELNGVDPSSKGVARGSFFCMLSNCFVERQHILDAKKALLHEFSRNELNEPSMRSYVERFYSDMVLDFSLIDLIVAEMGRLDGQSGGQGSDGLGSVDSKFYKVQLRNSDVEHISVVDKFVSQIELSQLCSVLRLAEDEVIGFITEIVNEKYGTIKINQPEGLVDFGAKKMSDRVDDLLDKIVEACNLIHQDSMH